MSRMKSRAVGVAFLLGVTGGCAQSPESGGGQPAPAPAPAPAAPAAAAPAGDGWIDSFTPKACTLSSTGRNPYFILEPGHQVVLGKKGEEVAITVLDATEKVDGVETRVVEERETANGRLKEVSRNFFAICKEHNDVFYFGEDVDDYKDGKIVDHGGAWRAGQKGARAGLIMPGKPAAGFRHYQEVAPGEAMDRAEIKETNATVETPAGTFTNCLTVIETSPLEPGHESLKRYAPGIGMIQDEKLLLVRQGKAETKAAPAKAAAAETKVKKEKKKKKDKKAKPDTAAKEKKVPAGKITEVEIKLEEMPAKLAAKVKELHPTGTVKEVKQETHPDGMVVYAVEVMVDGVQHDVEITKEGKVIRNKKE